MAYEALVVIGFGIALAFVSVALFCAHVRRINAPNKADPQGTLVKIEGLTSALAGDAAAASRRKGVVARAKGGGKGVGDDVRVDGNAGYRVCTATRGSQGPEDGLSLRACQPFDDCAGGEGRGNGVMQRSAVREEKSSEELPVRCA